MLARRKKPIALSTAARRCCGTWCVTQRINRREGEKIPLSAQNIYLSVCEVRSCPAIFDRGSVLKQVFDGINNAGILQEGFS